MGLMTERPIQVFFGTAGMHFAHSVCSILDMPAANASLHRSSVIGNPIIQIEANVTGQHVYIVQNVTPPLGENFMELLFWVVALNRAGAESVTAIIPCFGYLLTRGSFGVSNQARICVDALEASGVKRLVTVGLQDATMASLCRIPYENLNTTRVICNLAIEKLSGQKTQVEKLGKGYERLDQIVVVSENLNQIDLAQNYGKELEAPTAVTMRYRSKDNVVPAPVVGANITGKTVLIVDEYLASEGYLINAASTLDENGAAKIYAAVSHTFLNPQLMQRLEDSKIKGIWVTDSVANSLDGLTSKFEVISLAPLLAEAIQRLHKLRE